MGKKLNILLLGEYSNYHNNLAVGLKELNHNVVLANAGDHYKNFYRDIDLSYKSKNKFSTNIKRIWIENTNINSLKNFDIVQIINPNVFSRFGNNIQLFKKILANNDKVFLSAVGDDYFYWKAYRDGKFKKSPHPGALIDENKKTSIWETSTGLINATKFLAENVNGIIPGSVSYLIPYRNHSNCRNVILQPLNVSKIEFKENQFNEKIVFFHGAQIGRYGFKGTHAIDEAMYKAAGKYKSDIIYKRSDSLPYNQYLETINETNVLIDQANSNEPAMNALIGMAKGKIVMGGCEDIFLKTHELKHPPLINITNDAKQIGSQVEWILDSKKEFMKLSIEGRAYVKDNHDATQIAQKFIKEWTS